MWSATAQDRIALHECPAVERERAKGRGDENAGVVRCIGADVVMHLVVLAAVQGDAVRTPHRLDGVEAEGVVFARCGAVRGEAPGRQGIVSGIAEGRLLDGGVL